MFFDKKILKAILFDESDDHTLIYDIIDGQTRWETQHEMVFQDLKTKKFYKTSYSKGSTEYQDNGIEFYDMDCAEVVPVEVKVIKYVPIATV
jgi:hypothetical protein